MAGIGDAPVIAVLVFDDNTLTWVNQETDVPIALPPLVEGATARILVRAINLEDSEGHVLPEESVHY
jgi:hypothetical protein